MALTRVTSSKVEHMTGSSTSPGPRSTRQITNDLSPEVIASRAANRRSMLALGIGQSLQHAYASDQFIRLDNPGHGTHCTYESRSLCGWHDAGDGCVDHCSPGVCQAGLGRDVDTHRRLLGPQRRGHPFEQGFGCCHVTLTSTRQQHVDQLVNVLGDALANTT
jgi:hypothetical protein